MTDTKRLQEPYKKITPTYMVLILASTLIFSVLYYSIALLLNHHPMHPYDYIIFTSILVFLITGGYQLFFWVQNNNFFFKVRFVVTKLDGLIPFWPIWIWPYSLFYYFMIGMTMIQINSIQEGIYLAFGGLMLLFIQCIFFLIFPCKVPENYRNYEVNSISKRFLKLVQSIDNGRNCFPSMHNSVAVYVALFLVPSIGIFSYLFIIMIALSTVFVKQHTIIDALAGLILGWCVFTSLQHIII